MKGSQSTTLDEPHHGGPSVNLETSHLILVRNKGLIFLHIWHWDAQKMSRLSSCEWRRLFKRVGGIATSSLSAGPDSCSLLSLSLSKTVWFTCVYVREREKEGTRIDLTSPPKSRSSPHKRDEEVLGIKELPKEKQAQDKIMRTESWSKASRKN